MPKILISLYIFFSFLLLTACTPNETLPQTASEQQPAQPTVAALEPAETEVLISRNLGFGEINSRVYLKLEGEEHVRTFREADRNKHQLQGMMDVRHPDFDVVFNSESEIRQLHLWLPRDRDEQAMVTEIEETGTGYLLTPTSTKVIRDLIENYRYDSEQAVNNGDVVQTIGKIENFGLWEDFLEAVEQSRPASVQRVGYTIEGDPIFDNLDFDGQMISYVSDNTLDKFGLPTKDFDTCEKAVIEPIPAEHQMPGNVYRLDGCSNTKGGLNKHFWFAVPDEVEIIRQTD